MTAAEAQAKQCREAHDEMVDDLSSLVGRYIAAKEAYEKAEKLMTEAHTALQDKFAELKAFKGTLW